MVCFNQEERVAGLMFEVCPFLKEMKRGYYNDQAIALPDFLDHLVKESCRRVSIGSETRPVYVQSIYVPSLWVWDRRYIQWKFVVQMSGK